MQPLASGDMTRPSPQLQGVVVHCNVEDFVVVFLFYETVVLLNYLRAAYEYFIYFFVCVDDDGGSCGGGGEKDIHTYDLFIIMLY